MAKPLLQVPGGQDADEPAGEGQGEKRRWRLDRQPDQGPERCVAQEAEEVRGGPAVLGTAAGAAALACAAANRHQIGFWRDSGALFQHALAVTENNNIALMRLGDHFRQQRRMTEAMEMYRRAIQLDPLMEEPQVNLGVLLYLGGRQDEGIQHLEGAVKLLPNSAMVHSNLGLFLADRGRLDEAAGHLETALRLKPDYPEAHVALGDVCLKKGRREAAFEHYRQALKLRPGFAPAERRLQSIGPG